MKKTLKIAGIITLASAVAAVVAYMIYIFKICSHEMDDIDLDDDFEEDWDEDYFEEFEDELE